MPENDDKRDMEPEDRTMRQRLEGLIPDLVKRTFYAGLGAVFTTEEGIRKLAAEFSLPKDVANYLISSAGAARAELFRIVGRELREFLQNLNVNQELVKLLTALSFEIRTEIRFIPNEEAVGGVKPQVKPRVTVKRTRENGGGEEPA